MDIKNVIVGIFILVSCVCAVIPLTPAMPVLSLDWSWMLGVNEAMARHFSFGDEIVMTFGPYASLYTTAYHPATDSGMMLVGILLAGGYAICLIRLSLVGQARWAIVTCLLLVGVMRLRDVLFLFYPLLLSVALYRTPSASLQSRISRITMVLPGVVVLAALGALPLIKGTFLLVSATTSLCCIAYLVAGGRYRLATAFAVVPTVSMLFLWLWAGQTLGALPLFVGNLYAVISGYTDAMSLAGRRVEPIAFIVAAGSVCIHLAVNRFESKWSRPFLFMVFALYLFVLFKGSFVRHDGHAMIGGLGLLIGALLLFQLPVARHAIVPVILAVVTWAIVDARHVSTSTTSFIEQLQASYSSGWRGFRARVRDPDSHRRQYAAALTTLRAQGTLPTLPGTSDIYSFQQVYLIASGNTWSPRPTFQSYAAYTPSLLAANANHLLSPAAPSSIFFKVEPIDGRLPATEDGLSWPVLLRRYRPAGMEGEFLTLVQTNDDSAPVSVPGDPEATIEARLNEPVSVPASDDLTYVQIDLRQSIYGKIASFLFKPTELRIKLDLADGSQVTYRLVSTMARSRFLLSPLVRDTSDFLSLYEDRRLLGMAEVRSFTIEGKGPTDAIWQSAYTVSFSHDP